VRLFGVVTGEGKWKLFSSADVFAYPTYFEAEAMPIACLEAMMFALPVVATEWRALPEVVADGETGYLVAVRDVGALAGRLAELLGDPDLRRRMGQRGRERFLERFTADRHAEEMRRVFQSVGRQSPKTARGTRVGGF